MHHEVSIRQHISSMRQQQSVRDAILSMPCNSEVFIKGDEVVQPVQMVFVGAN
jgi:hypothetical protein